MVDATGTAQTIECGEFGVALVTDPGSDRNVPALVPTAQGMGDAKRMKFDVKEQSASVNVTTMCKIKDRDIALVDLSLEYFLFPFGQPLHALVDMGLCHFTSIHGMPHLIAHVLDVADLLVVFPPEFEKLPLVIRHRIGP